MAATCNERGELLEAIRGKYHEFCSAMAAAMARLQQASNRNAVALNDARKKTAADLREIQRLSVEGARSRVAAEVGLKETSTRRVIHRIITPGLVSESASYII